MTFAIDPRARLSGFSDFESALICALSCGETTGTTAPSGRKDHHPQPEIFQIVLRGKPTLTTQRKSTGCDFHRQPSIQKYYSFACSGMAISFASRGCSTTAISRVFPSAAGFFDTRCRQPVGS